MLDEMRVYTTLTGYIQPKKIFYRQPRFARLAAYDYSIPHKHCSSLRQKNTFLMVQVSTSDSEHAECGGVSIRRSNSVVRKKCHIYVLWARVILSRPTYRGWGSKLATSISPVSHDTYESRLQGRRAPSVAVGEKYKKYDFSKSKVYFKVIIVGTLTSICRRTRRATTLKFGGVIDAS